jgi:hypothetical protein
MSSHSDSEEADVNTRDKKKPPEKQTNTEKESIIRKVFEATPVQDIYNCTLCSPVKQIASKRV